MGYCQPRPSGYWAQPPWGDLFGYTILELMHLLIQYSNEVYPNTIEICFNGWKEEILEQTNNPRTHTRLQTIQVPSAEDEAQAVSSLLIFMQETALACSFKVAKREVTNIAWFFSDFLSEVLFISPQATRKVRQSDLGRTFLVTSLTCQTRTWPSPPPEISRFPLAVAAIAVTPFLCASFTVYISWPVSG